MVKKLALTTTPHPKYYKHDWISMNGDILVKEQVSVLISICKYEKNVVFDVVPMEI